MVTKTLVSTGCVPATRYEQRLETRILILIRLDFSVRWHDRHASPQPLSLFHMNEVELIARPMSHDQVESLLEISILK